MLVAGDDERFCFRHALLREALYDDLLPGRARRAAPGAGPGAGAALRPTTTREARAGGADRRPLRGRRRPAGGAARHRRAPPRPAERVHRLRRGGRAAERALELWPRVADGRAPAGLDHVELLDAGRRRPLRRRRPRPRRGAAAARRCASSTPSADPAATPALLARLARTMWSLNRGAEAVETAERALAHAARRRPARAAPSLLAWLARTKFLRGRFREAAADGEEALAAAVAGRRPRAEGEVLNTLGMAQVALGDRGGGRPAASGRSSWPASTRTSTASPTAYSNLADMLNHRGRTDEALATAREGLAATPRGLIRSHDWMIADRLRAGLRGRRLGAGRASTWPPAEPLSGVVLIFRQLREAELALGRATRTRPRAPRGGRAAGRRAPSEPQWIGAATARCCGELRRRQRDLDGARAAVEDALDRLELCTDDVMRIARVTAVGMRGRGRSPSARGTCASAAACATRWPGPGSTSSACAAAAQEGGPVERAYWPRHAPRLAAGPRPAAPAGEWQRGGAGLGCGRAALPGRRGPLARGRGARGRAATARPPAQAARGGAGGRPRGLARDGWPARSGPGRAGAARVPRRQRGAGAPAVGRARRIRSG